MNTLLEILYRDGENNRHYAQEILLGSSNCPEIQDKLDAIKTPNGCVIPLLLGLSNDCYPFDPHTGDNFDEDLDGEYVLIWASETSQKATTEMTDKGFLEQLNRYDPSGYELPFRNTVTA